jgi:hypothetical protein
VKEGVGGGPGPDDLFEALFGGLGGLGGMGGRRGFAGGGARERRRGDNVVHRWRTGGVPLPGDRYFVQEQAKDLRGRAGG